MSYSIGTDIGGTFTDCVVVDAQGRITTGKAPTTPSDRSAGFFDAVTDAAGKLGLGIEDLLAQTETLVHATTTATNAVVEHKGATVGLITTKGHGECLSIMRGAGRSKGLDVDDLLYLPGTSKPPPLVAPHLISEITERVDFRGEVVVALDEAQLRGEIARLLDAGAETLAIAFLWSLTNPAHEQRARAIAHELAPDVFVSCSHEIAPRVGEYYRFVATVMNSYVGPLMTRYTDRIDEGARARGYRRPVLFAQCIGGTAPAAEARRRPLLTLDSGPVSGIVASNFLGEAVGYRNIITADMGGTTFDVSVIAANQPQRRESTNIDKFEMYLPMLDVESIGAGGGSIAWIDPASGTMKVGPRSAGAEPGPICYSRGGTEPTVTDADVVLGFVNPSAFLGGRQQLDAEAARAGIARLGEQIGKTVEETAAGISEIADNLMAEKIRRMTVYRGFDPRDFVVFAFGGAGPVHAGAFARDLGVQAVVVPIGNIASVLSAMGTVSSDVVHVHDKTTKLLAPFDMDALDVEFAALEDAANAQLVEEGFNPSDIVTVRYVSMKYGAQTFDLEIPLEAGSDSAATAASFEAAYEQRYGKGSGFAPAGIEIMRIRVHASGRLPRPHLLTDRARPTSNGTAPATRPVWWRERGGWIDTPVYTEVAGRIDGPAIVELPDTTVPVRPDAHIDCDDHGNLILRFD
ncbi:hydantoinase/oxoprolinase family protein [Paraconexibacter sp. AEG42_29]|uniref:hydantoinase/oxoprolinase family protein n=1 Tax=Paraconexibacter sp. AEG42_29 TaxID=2997339 RepID=UPI00339D5518